MKILIVIPVYNEEGIIKKNLQQLIAFCKKNLADDWQIVAADNQSTDKTALIVKKMALLYPRLTYFYLNKKGKGLAISRAWQRFAADIYCFMDADLATGLSALPKLIKAVANERYDLAVGSRRLSESVVQRNLIRRVVSRIYNWLVRFLLKSKIKDHACGFKAVNQRVVKEILPLIKNQQWFFDTELLILAQQRGFRIKEVPIYWAESRTYGQSKVRILLLIIDYWQEIWRLRKIIK